MGRFASAFAFLAVLVVILGSAGCGQRFDELGGGLPPGQASFAADALTALEEAGSAHVVVDAQAGAIMGTNAQVGIQGFGIERQGHGRLRRNWSRMMAAAAASASPAPAASASVVV